MLTLALAKRLSCQLQQELFTYDVSKSLEKIDWNKDENKKRNVNKDENKKRNVNKDENKKSNVNKLMLGDRPWLSSEQRKNCKTQNMQRIE